MGGERRRWSIGRECVGGERSREMWWASRGGDLRLEGRLGGIPGLDGKGMRGGTAVVLDADGD